jgi:hypothetical protein|tara:strand:+ start:759 stop:1181 length:423 start_codon:yes stop_codon:yes gene_type:complete
MKTSKESINWYNKSNGLWESNGFPIRFSSSSINETVDFETAKKVVKRFWKKEMNCKRIDLFPYDIKEGSGNRFTWVHYNRKKKGSRQILTINTESGWPNIIHDFGHWIGYYKRHRPHCVDHALIEWRFTNFFFDGKYNEK